VDVQRARAEHTEAITALDSSRDLHSD